MISRVRVGDILQRVQIPVSLTEDGKYTAIGIRSFGKGIIHYPPTSREHLSKLRFFHVPPHTLALSNIKAWEGAVALTTDADASAIASHRFLFYTPKHDEIDIRFVHYYFLSKQGISQLGRISPGSADRNRTLGRKLFEELRIPLPTVTEQRRISDKLDAVLSRVDSVYEMRERMARLQRSLRESLVATAVESAIEKVRMGKIVTLERAPLNITSDAEYRAIGMRSFGKGIIHYPPSLGSDLSKLSYFTFPANALILSNIKAWEGAVAVTGVEESRNYIASNRFLTYLPVNDRANVSYLRHYLLSHAGTAKVSAASPGAADRNRTLGHKRFEAIEIPLPSRPVQNKVARTLDILAARLGEAHAQPAFEALRPSILNAAFSGQF